MSSNIDSSFFNYLINIGIFNDNNSSGNKLVYKSNDIIYKQSQLLLNHFKLLTDTDKQIMTNNIITKYYQNKLKNKMNKLKSIIVLYNPKYKKTKLIHYFKKWYIIIKKHKSKNKQLNIITNNNSKHNINNCLTETNTYSKIERSWEKKEREEYEQCTFKPITSRSRQHSKDDCPVYERLYNNMQKIETKKEIKRKIYDKRFNSDISFSPKINTNYPLRKDSFDHRQIIYKHNKEQHRLKLINDIESFNDSNCTFVPKTNHYYQSSYNQTSFQQRLKNDENLRKIKYAEYQNNSYNNSKNKVKVDYNRINELYSQYKEKSMKINQIKNQLDIENGISFSPNVNVNNKYYAKIKSNIYQRSNNAIKQKQQFINNFIEQRDRNMRLSSSLLKP